MSYGLDPIAGPHGSLRELALFAGGGGGILGGHLLGWRTVCAVEREPYPIGVLLARQNDGILPPFPVWDDVCTFDGTAWRGCVDVVSGGFPCQDISPAGKQAGLSGARSGLWFEMLRIIREVGSEWVFIENSDRLVGPKILQTVLDGLAEAGYVSRVGLLSAADCGAWHTRKRCWIVARRQRVASYAVRHRAGEEVRFARGQGEQAQGPEGRGQCHESGLCHHSSPDSVSDRVQVGFTDSTSRPARNSTQPHHGGADAPRIDRGECLGERLHPRSTRGGSEAIPRGAVEALTDSHGLRPLRSGRGTAETGRDDIEDSDGLQFLRWPFEPAVAPLVHGFPGRVDEVKALGNAQVPRVAAAAFTLLSRHLI